MFSSMLPFLMSPSRCYRFRSSMFPYSMLTFLPDKTVAFSASLLRYQLLALFLYFISVNFTLTFIPLKDEFQALFCVPKIFQYGFSFTDAVVSQKIRSRNDFNCKQKKTLDVKISLRKYSRINFERFI